MARLTDEQRGLILADFHTGHYTQRELAKRYNCSPRTINKLVKGVEPKHTEKVNAIATAKAELAKESPQEVNAVYIAIEKKTEATIKINKIQNKALDKADKMLDDVDNAGDLKTIVDAVDKASITLKVSERHAPKTEISTTAQLNSIQYVGFREITEKETNQALEENGRNTSS